MLVGTQRRLGEQIFEVPCMLVSGRSLYDECHEGHMMRSDMAPGEIQVGY